MRYHHLTRYEHSQALTLDRLIAATTVLKRTYRSKVSDTLVWFSTGNQVRTNSKHFNEYFKIVRIATERTQKTTPRCGDRLNMLSVRAIMNFESKRFPLNSNVS